jgi:large subunit ribosomal protein L17
LRNLTISLLISERDAEGEDNAPKVKGRIITTLEKAKEMRPFIERCITIARRSLKHTAAAAEFATDADRGTEAWKTWKKSDRYTKWVAAVAPAVTARRRVFKLLRNKQAIRILFDDIAARFADRPGGYTRIMRLAKPRLGDAGTRAIIEFVGVRDRAVQRSPAPRFEEPQTA